MENNLRALELLKDIYNVDQLLSGKEYIKELVHRLAQILKVKYVLVGHAVEPDRQKIQTDYLWAGSGFADNVVYELEDTPCVNVICGTRVNCYASDVQLAFPKDQMLKDFDVESYIGAPFLHTDGRLIGLLVIMDDKPMEERELYTSVVEFFAARIGTEYRRQAVEDSLRRINENLEKLAQERTLELQRAFESLQQTQKQLISQEKLATIGRITFGIAHELKNPLNIIINSAQLLEEDDLDPESTKKATDMIYQHSQRANTIITNMLRQARQETDMEPEWINISEMLEHCLDVYVRSLTDVDLKTHLVVQKNITPNVYANVFDPPSIERVLINIIDNSLYALGDKYKKNKNSFTPSIKVDLIAADATFKIIVRDNGSGIPQKHLANVCDEFYTTKPAGEGTGLGLWIAKQNVEKNRGEIHIESEENQFTQVTIELPGQQRTQEAQL
ncbi:GAF domain-containing sensor histidine kinase [Bdellovibrio sp. BCCA]|uniref:GAF domain-containing sensor histidine kinase n=1 Tax=Bdellovibrio sp. BCCA TaxID=3136281 RepID=UPI0030F22DB0